MIGTDSKEPFHNKKEKNRNGRKSKNTKTVPQEFIIEKKRIKSLWKKKARDVSYVPRLNPQTLTGLCSSFSKLKTNDTKHGKAAGIPVR